MSIRAVCVVAGVLLATPGGLRCQASDAGDLPPVFAALAGTWSGTGTLMGRAASFEMTWTPRENGFVELRFSNGFVDPSGTVTAVLEARAIYRVSGASAVGVWIDTRPQRIQLEAEITEDAVITTWTAPAERGRTEYRLEGAGAIVRDFVEVDGALRPFGEATYTRSTARR